MLSDDLEYLRTGLDEFFDDRSPMTPELQELLSARLTEIVDGIKRLEGAQIGPHARRTARRTMPPYLVVVGGRDHKDALREAAS